MTEQSLFEGGEQGTREALTFARQIAKEEIDSIERIHKRTLQSFAYIGIVVAAAAAVFGYIGYANLRDAAITTAENQMRTEVTHQIQEKLTQQNVEGIVAEQVRNYSATKMSDAIHRELMMPAQSTMIRAAAADEARNQIRQQFSPRHFTEAQSKKFINAVSQEMDLDGYPVIVQAMVFSSEAESYAQEIRKSIAQTKLKLLDAPGFEMDRVGTGVTIYRDQNSPDSFARKLQNAFLACGIDAKIVPAPPPTPPKWAGDKVPIEVFVGPSHI